MMLPPAPRRKARSRPPERRRIHWEEHPEAFSQAFDFRPLNHSSGTAIRGSSLGRPAALRAPSVVDRPSYPSHRGSDSVDRSWTRAADNAAELEWAQARTELDYLAHKSMSAAEAGIRLSSLIRRVPSLLANGLGSELLSDVEGAGKTADRKRELLPLPLPKLKPVGKSEMVELFESSAIITPHAQRLGAEAWQHLLELHIDVFDASADQWLGLGPVACHALARRLTEIMAERYCSAGEDNFD